MMCLPNSSDKDRLWLAGIGFLTLEQGPKVVFKFDAGARPIAFVSAFPAHNPSGDNHPMRREFDSRAISIWINERHWLKDAITVFRLGFQSDRIFDRNRQELILIKRHTRFVTIRVTHSDHHSSVRIGSRILEIVFQLFADDVITGNVRAAFSLFVTRVGFDAV